MSTPAEPAEPAVPPTPRPPLTMGELDAIPVTKLKGVGPKRVEALASMGIASVLDLLTHYPRRFVDRTNEARVADLVDGAEALVLVTVRSATTRPMRQRGRSMVVVDCADDTGSLSLTFFNQGWRARQLQPGLMVAVFGRTESFRSAKRMTNPVVDLVGDRTGRIVPIYPQSEKAGLTTWEIAGLVEEALTRCRPRGIADPVPPAVLAAHALVARQRAIEGIHRPETMAETRAARDRLVFDELLRVQLALVGRKRALAAESVGIAHVVDGGLLDRFHAALGFPLTGAQQRVIAQIAADLAAAHPMHRLLQGDVGAGKTVVALSALLLGVQGGHQGALMAPTEVLAEQHALGVRRLLDGVSVPDPTTLMGERPLRVELLTNRTPAAERRRILAGLADGSVELVIGTHALIQDAVAFHRLGVVVIDEQHRFGVEQRAALRRANAEGRVPDVLVMTATPIPRTAAMTIYGDLDVSVLDELPPGRTPIETIWVRGPLEAVAMWNHVRSAVAEGRQVYVVCPLVEASETLDVASAEETFEALSGGELHDLSLGLLHGRMKGDDKDAVMTDFRERRTQVLVATTVIEVGVDVPNATVMVVLDADRFGIAQLHQLRGRVGRGRLASTCYLVSGVDVEGNPTGTEESAAEANPRLEALVATTDGFALAEVDLDLRGEGRIAGTHQSGRNDLKLASLRRDRAWVLKARAAAEGIHDADPGLASSPLLREEVERFFDEDSGRNEENLFKD